MFSTNSATLAAVVSSVSAGENLLSSGQYKQALEFFEIALKEDGENSYLFYGKGEALYNLENFKEALANYEIALNFNPKNFEALRGKGNALRVLSRNQEGLESCEAALNINPEDAEALLGKGVALLKLDRNQEASSCFKRVFEKFDEIYKKSDSKNLKALSRLAQCYRNGWGVEKDLKEAIKLDTKIASLGNANAQLSLGHCYYHGQGVTQDYKLAVEWYIKAAEQGNVYAQYRLGCCYFDGEGVTNNDNLAVTWFFKAAEQGHADSQYRLGCCYYHGQGVTQDYKLAVEWYFKAAEQGNMNAEYSLGDCHLHGYGVVKDNNSVVKWFTRAAEHGNADAQYNLGVFYEEGNVVSEDLETSAKWYKNAAEQGNLAAQRRLNYKKKCVEIIKKKAKDGKLIYKKIEQEEFNALLVLLQENHPIVSLTFSYSTVREGCSSIGECISRGYDPYRFSTFAKGEYVHSLSNSNLTKLFKVLLTNNTVTHFECIWPGPDSHSSNTIPVELFSRLLATNRTLMEVGLSGYSHCQEEMIETMANALIENQTLTKLVLSNSFVDDKKASLLANMLLKNKTILNLDLSGNPGISKDILKLIRYRLAINKKHNNAAIWFLVLSEYPYFADKYVEEKNTKRWSQYKQWKEKVLQKGLLDNILKLPRDLQKYMVSFSEGVTPDEQYVRSSRLKLKESLEHLEAELGSTFSQSYQQSNTSSQVFSVEALKAASAFRVDPSSLSKEIAYSTPASMLASEANMGADVTQLLTYKNMYELRLMVSKEVPKQLKLNHSPAIVQKANGMFEIIVNRGQSGIQKISAPDGIDLKVLQGLFKKHLWEQSISLPGNNPIIQWITAKGGHSWQVTEPSKRVACQ